MAQRAASSPLSDRSPIASPVSQFLHFGGQKKLPGGGSVEKFRSLDGDFEIFDFQFVIFIKEEAHKIEIEVTGILPGGESVFPFLPVR